MIRFLTLTTDYSAAELAHACRQHASNDFSVCPLSPGLNCPHGSAACMDVETEDWENIITTTDTKEE